MDESVLSNEDIQEIVGKYSHDQFMGEEPYQILTELGDDELLLERVKAALREQAKRCRVPMNSFDSMAKAAIRAKKKEKEEEEKRRQEDERSEKEEAARNDQITGLSDLLEQKTPNFGQYICTNRSMYRPGVYSMEKFCGHPAFLTKRYVNIETGSELMDVSYKLDGVWKTKRLVDRKILSQARTITSLSEYGMDITSENASAMVSYFSEIDTLNRDIIPRKETVSRLGWIDGRGFSPYIQDVEYDNGGKFADAFAAVRTEGSFEKWKATAARIMTDKQFLPARIVLAASVASAVLKWTCQQPFMVHLWATESGTGKTISLMLATSVWANPELGLFMRSMNATRVANEQMAGFCNNLPLVLDELQTVQKSTDFDEIIYMLCEGTGKARGAREGGLREQARWLNTIITSGEQPISADSRAGAVNRVVSIEATKQVIPDEMSEFADTLRENYGWAGKMLIDEINGDETRKDMIRGYYNRNVKKLLPLVTGKQANYGAALMTGDILLCVVILREYGFEPIRAEELLPYLATTDMVDTNQKVKGWLIDFVGRNAARFRKWDESDAEKLTGEVYGEICNDGSVKIIKNVLKDQMDARGWSLPSFMRWCDERGLVESNHSEANRHWEVWHKIKGMETSVQVMHFRERMFRDAGTPVEVALPF